MWFNIKIYDRSGKRYISAQKLKIELLASKDSAKLAVSNDAIVALVAASILDPYTDIGSICGRYYLEI